MFLDNGAQMSVFLFRSSLDVAGRLLAPSLYVCLSKVGKMTVPENFKKIFSSKFRRFSHFLHSNIVSSSPSALGKNSIRGHRCVLKNLFLQCTGNFSFFVIFRILSTRERESHTSSTHFSGSSFHDASIGGLFSSVRCVCFFWQPFENYIYLQ